MAQKVKLVHLIECPRTDWYPPKPVGTFEKPPPRKEWTKKEPHIIIYIFLEGTHHTPRIEVPYEQLKVRAGWKNVTKKRLKWLQERLASELQEIEQDPDPEEIMALLFGKSTVTVNS